MAKRVYMYKILNPVPGTQRDLKIFIIIGLNHFSLRRKIREMAHTLQEKRISFLLSFLLTSDVKPGPRKGTYGGTGDGDHILTMAYCGQLLSFE